MTEKEYFIEMLCSLPKDILEDRINGSGNIPDWLIGIPYEDIKEALCHYDEKRYTVMREMQRAYY